MTPSNFKTSTNRLAIVVMGVSGSGKSTVGRLLAEQSGGVFYDADAFHPAANLAKMKRGEPLDDLDRAPWLDILGKLLADSRDACVVLACSALKERYRETLKSAGPDLQFVHLMGSPELIRSRLRARRGHFMPESLIDSQFSALEAPEDALAVSIDQPVAEIVRIIIQELSISKT
jgi:gluconokinase